MDQITVKESPVPLWCFCFDFAANVLSLCASMHYSPQGCTPYEITCNCTPYIFEYVTFVWYSWVFYWDEHHSKEKKIGHWLGLVRPDEDMHTAIYDPEQPLAIYDDNYHDPLDNEYITSGYDSIQDLIKSYLIMGLSSRRILYHFWKILVINWMLLQLNIHKVMPL